MNRQPWCTGSGRQVGAPHTIGGRLSSCPSCGRAEIQINRDGTLRYHVTMLLEELTAPARSRENKLQSLFSFR